MARRKQTSRIRRLIRWGVKYSLKIVVILTALTVVQVAILRYVRPPCTVRMIWGWAGQKIAAKPYQPPFYVWRSIGRISPHLQRAVLAGEDQRFLLHHGFDFVELRHAIADIITADRVRGASTISMQTARSVFLLPSRSWLRKIAEGYYTVLIELLWGKRRILEIYLNTVDWGANLMGAEAAARKYFHKQSVFLEPSEAALMAAVLTNPHRWSPTSGTGYVRARQQRIMRDMERMITP